MSLTDTSGSIRDALPETKKADSSSSVQTDIAPDDDYTITAYGDISQSEVYLVPSVPSEVHATPTRESGTCRRHATRPLPPQLKKNMLLRTQDKSYEDDSIAKQAQKAAMSQPELDFNTLVATLRERRTKVSQGRPAMPYLKSIEARANSPTRMAKDAEVVVAEPGTAKPIPPPSKLANSSARPDEKANTPSPPSKSPVKPKPWRTGPLPLRPPLPRWEFTDPDVVLVGMDYRLRSCLST